MFSRKAKDYGVCVITNTVFERMDGTQKQLHKGKWIQNIKSGGMTEKNKQNIFFLTIHLKPRMKIRRTRRKKKKTREPTAAEAILTITFAMKCLTSVRQPTTVYRCHQYYCHPD